MSEEIFKITATWDSAGKKGTLVNGDGSLKIPHGGASSLGGGHGIPNPEELLLAAVSACFVQTWAIFLSKLTVPIEAPVLEGSCELEKDPAGGYRLTKLDLAPHVPAALWQSRREDVEKTLSLAVRYCIVSKAVKASIIFTVTPKPV